MQDVRIVVKKKNNSGNWRLKNNKNNYKRHIITIKYTIGIFKVLATLNKLA